MNNSSSVFHRGRPTLKSLLLCSLLLIWFLGTSCSNDDISEDVDPPKKGVENPETEKTADYEITYQFHPGVRIFGEKELSYVNRIDDDGTIYMVQNTPEKYIPKQGDIISARTSEKTPYGLGCRVTSIIYEDNLYQIKTEPAALDEIFQKLELNYKTSTIFDKIPTIVDEDGNEIEVSVEESRGRYQELVLQLSKVVGTNDNGLFVEGTAGISANLVAYINLKDKIYEFSIEPSISLNLTCGIKGSVNFEPHWWIKDVVLATSVVPIGPITLRPTIKADIGSEGVCEGELSVGISKRYGFKVGANQNGLLFENRTESTDLINSLNIDAKIGVTPIKVRPKLVMGLYTTNVAVGIDASAGIDLATNLQLGNLNLFRNESNLEVAVTGDIDVECYARLFSKEFFNVQKSLASFTFYSTSCPLLPQLDEASFSISKTAGGASPVFEASYILGPSFLSKFVKMHAGLAIYRGGNLVKLIPSGQNINWQNSSKFTFSVNGLETDISYTAKPYLEIFDRRFDHNGIPFSSASPTAAITDIVQTGSAKGKFTHYGSEFDYEFYFFINSEIRGSENCREWGIYSPLSVNIWNPNPLQDGRVTQYWTGWSNQTSFVWEATPYAILIGSDDPILYETHSALLSLDGIYSSPRRANGAPGLRTVQGDGFVLRLDSIAYDRPDGVRNILR